jgi:hypothetical protein
MPSDDGVPDAVRALWQALSRRDWEAVETFLSADCYLRRDAGRPALAARGPDDIVKWLKVGPEPLPGYEHHDGLLLCNGSDVMDEHSETLLLNSGKPLCCRSFRCTKSLTAR